MEIFVFGYRHITYRDSLSTSELQQSHHSGSMSHTIGCCCPIPTAMSQHYGRWQKCLLLSGYGGLLLS